MAFLGFSDVLLDAKHRLAIPAKFRRNLDPEKNGTQFVVVLGKPMNTLWLYPEKDFIRLSDRGEDTLIPSDEQREYDQAMFALGECLEPDAQGRILLPERLIKDAGFKREVVVCGARNHLEIWPKDAFERHLAESRARFHDLQEKARPAYRDTRRQPGQEAGD
jgi:MraZ protein